ncbi:MAG: CRISPR-associated helicase Cas3' [Candidatus Tenebribacter mawsonii]|nr:CRISPR-associated helicase Cas3' [Candidatus Tenebribacter mawsonii]
MNELQKLLGKPDQSLIEHTDKVLKIWQEIFLIHKEEITDNDFWKKSLVSVIFHDIGKIIDSFQEMMISIKENKYYNFDKNFRHELFSGIIVSLFLQNEILPVAAVFSHHKKLNDELFDGDRFRKLSFKIQYLNDFYKYYDNRLSDFKLNFDISIFGNFTKLTAEKSYILYKERIFWKRRDIIKKSDRIKYIFFKGILQTCDWFASANKLLLDDLKIKEQNIKSTLENKIAISITFSDFQLKCLNTKKDCLVIAPTGSGKTEASLLWAGGKKGKLLYLLPTRVTSNAIYERMKDYFGQENLGLVHSGAYSFHKEINDNYEYSEYLLEKTFHKPLTVATVDQVLTCGFNIGYWEMKEFNCFNSRIIIDEIHSYDFYTLGLIIATIRHFKEMKAKFFIMSATIPEFLKKLILNELPEIQLIENKSLLEESRNLFEVHNCNIDELDEQIRYEVEQKRKVLIVVNTVNEAIRLYEKYHHYRPICYHSRFIQKHRVQKEKQIKEVSENNSDRNLVITTQVVEVSLDIDFDILFTENAPADAIVQRAGRVNRKREKKKNTKIVIYRHSDIAKKIYGEDILNNSFFEFQKYNNKRISEQQFIDIVNEVYKDVEVENNKDYNEGLKKYNEIQEHYNFIQDVPINDKNLYTRNFKDNVNISIIPMEFLEELADKKPLIMNKFVVDVPIWAKNNYRKDKMNRFLFLDVDYNDKRGVKLKKPEKNYSKYVM